MPGMATSPVKAALSVLPATLDDLGTFTLIQFEAISPTAPVDRVIHPRGPTETILAAATATKKRGFNRPEVYYKKVVARGDGEEDGDGKIVAFARWYVWAAGRNDDGWNKPYTYQPDDGLAPGDINVAAAAEYYGKADVMKKKHIQTKPHLCMLTPVSQLMCLSPADIPRTDISLVATRPAWQGKGCGRLLMDEAMRVALQHGFGDVFLISVAASRSFYERYGFETVDTLSLNLSSLDGCEDKKNDEWVDTFLLRATPS